MAPLDTMLDVGFVAASFVPLVLFWMYVNCRAIWKTLLTKVMLSFGDNHLRAVWRLSLGLDVIPALAVFVWRLSMDEPMMYKKDCMARTKIPYWLIIKRYWVQLLAVALIWCLYDFIIYPFNIYSSTIVNKSVEIYEERLLNSDKSHYAALPMIVLLSLWFWVGPS